MLRTGGRLTGRGLAGPWARGDGVDGSQAPRGGITRTPLRRASGVAAARALSAAAATRVGITAARRSGVRVHADEQCGLMHGEGRGAEGEDHNHHPGVESAHASSRPRRAAKYARRRPRRWVSSGRRRQIRRARSVARQAGVGLVNGIAARKEDLRWSVTDD